MTKGSTFYDVWDLDVFFSGGSSSQAFMNHLHNSKEIVEEFQCKVISWEPSNKVTDQDHIANLVEAFQGVAKKIRQAGAFVSCLHAQNTNDKKVGALRCQVTELSASLQNALTVFDQKLTTYDEQIWKEILKEEVLDELQFVLDERRLNALEKLSQEEETIINALSIDGYHGWGQLYDTIVGTIKVPFKDGNEMKEFSVGQASNKFSNPDRSVRKAVFQGWEESWSEKAEYLSKTLNHLAGFRLNMYKLRGWEDVLKEPLQLNRMQKQTLDTMWQVISDAKAPFVTFLERKAKLLGVDKLSWYDLDAPISQVESKVTYNEGADFIIEHFSRFGKEMTRFARKAFEQKWIEAEDRPGKAPGGFHTFFPESSQSRIFMTFSGTPANVSTLAHELGHGFHTYAMRDQHYLNRNYAMNVAETASTFAEMIVADASVKQAKNPVEKLALLEDKIQRSVALLMNIHSRFLFETRFYEERKNGVVGTDHLNELMKEAQQEAYGGALAEYHPLFWASKLHFFITGVPFYNFPYTFGYLFSLGIYAKAQEEGEGYEEKYIALLKDTASMTVEELASKHLNVDLTQPDFWQKAVQQCITDVEEFLSLTE
jgi:oligoendopeptidase F